MSRCSHCAERLFIARVTPANFFFVVYEAKLAPDDDTIYRFGSPVVIIQLFLRRQPPSLVPVGNNWVNQQRTTRLLYGLFGLNNDGVYEIIIIDDVFFFSESVFFSTMICVC